MWGTSKCHNWFLKICYKTWLLHKKVRTTTKNGYQVLMVFYFFLVGAATRYDCGALSAVVECKLDNFGSTNLCYCSGDNCNAKVEVKNGSNRPPVASVLIWILWFLFSAKFAYFWNFSYSDLMDLFFEMAAMQFPCNGLELCCVNFPIIFSIYLLVVLSLISIFSIFIGDGPALS